LLQEALGLSRQIGQRAATLKQLARVTIRQGSLDRAESYLEQALELYLELYGVNKLHINIAAVKFQQGALALQREQFEDAWLHFSECLRIRRHVYAYARPVGSSSKVDPTHLEVSCVQHELGRVAFAQGRFSQAMEMLKSERLILERLLETTTQMERLYQAQLTNLTWARKCAKEMGDEDEAARLSSTRTAMKKSADHKLKENETQLQPDSVALQHKASQSRLLTRRFALEKDKNRISDQGELRTNLVDLLEEISKAPPGSMKRTATQFHYSILQWIDKPSEARRVPILTACDKLRQVRKFVFPVWSSLFFFLT
jgi:tetratricopeptide (TPR) repeat protein